MAISENDILIENTDVAITGGDFDIQDCNNQNVKHLLIADAGNYIISPSLGVGIYRMQNEVVSDFREIFAKIGDQLKKDGYKYPEYTGENTSGDAVNLEITAIREKIPKRNTI